MNQPASSYNKTPSNAIYCGNIYPFTSTGKERDEETGYNYHGARYYDAGLMTGFISVDRYADKYPSLSPYHYCAWNPIKLIDPTGDTIKISGTKEEQTILKSLMVQYKKSFPKQYTKLEESKNIYNIQFSDGDDGSEGSFTYNYQTAAFDVNIKTNRGSDYSDIEVLSHEMKHAEQYEDGNLGFMLGFDLKDPSKEPIVMPIAYDIYDEIEAAFQANRVAVCKQNSIQLEKRTRSKYSALPDEKQNGNVVDWVNNNYYGNWCSPKHKIIHNCK